MSTNCHQTLGEYKKATGLTTRQMAERYEVSPRTIFRWLEGKPVAPGNVLKVHRDTGIPVGSLLGIQD